MIIPPSAKVRLPEHVDAQTGSVFCHGGCEVPLRHMGIEHGCQEYTCDVNTEECEYAGTCPKFRLIPLDGGRFQRVPSNTDHVQATQELRKNCERPFNLLNHQTGMEQVRVRSQQATQARCTLSNMAVLLIKMAGVRKKQPTSRPHQELLWETEKAA